MKAAFVLVAAAVALLLSAPPASAFDDVPAEHPNAAAIDSLAADGIIAGYPDGTFRPGGQIWRAQFAKMAVSLVGLPTSEHHACSFTDVEKSGNAGLYPDNFVAVAASSGITKGITATKFAPYRPITRQQVLSMLVRAADGLYPGLLRTPPADWQGQMPGAGDPDHGASTRKAEFNGLLDGLEPASLDPWSPATRAEAAQIMANLLPLPATIVEPFDVDLAMSHTRYLVSQIGVRRGGTEGERKAGDYLAGTLRLLGYQAGFQTFALTNGAQSRNVVATLAGSRPETIVIGGHYDTKSPSRGANDNGTGVGAILELARVLEDEPLDFSVKFVLFGTEEMIDGDPNHHHFGSRYYVASLSDEERALTKGMISVDMIGYGPEFRVRTMGRGKQSLKDALLSLGRPQGLSYLRDTGSSGWSDHEPFELAGIPAAWLEWRDYPWIHTAEDLAWRVDKNKVRLTGQLVLDYLRALDADKLDALAAY